MTRRIRREEIYDALFDDTAFEQLPKQMADAVGARSAIIGWMYEEGQQSFLGHSGYWSDDNIRTYLTHFAHLDPWTIAASAALEPDTVMNMADLVSDAEWERSTLFNEFFRPMGDDTYRSVSVCAENRWGRGNIAFHLGRSAGGFDPKALASLEDVAPHVGRLLGMRARLSALELEAKTSRKTLDLMPQATLVVSATGKILQANQAGELLLKEGDIFRSRGGKLDALGSRAAELLSSIRLACDDSAPSSSAILLEKSNGGRVVVTTLPFQLAALTARTALLLIQDVLPADPGIEKRLQSIFSLTTAEAEIAKFIAHGWSPSEIAEQRQASLGTVRSQIKSLMGKLGCRRQSEVAAVVRSILPVPEPHAS